MADTIVLIISGMSCHHCVKNVTGAIKAVAGVVEVDVNLEQGFATITGSAEAEQLTAAVKEAGFEAKIV